jgi:hypothetical protein
LCERYLVTVRRQKAKTLERKTAIIERIGPSTVPRKNGRRIQTSHWPTGELTQVGKIKPSDCDVWLARYTFRSASRNLYIGCLEELFALAVRDRVIARSSRST